MAEALNGSFKAECHRLHGPWRTKSQLEHKVISWIHWYNAKRLHSSLGMVPPLEHEASWYRQQQAAIEAA